jgi:hypothetical protein
MKRSVMAVALAALMAPAGGAAQDGGWWSPVADRLPGERGEMRTVRAAEDGARRGQDARRGNGPPFCRNGEGHPVHGRAWCRDKGWEQGGEWRDVSWEDVIFGRPDTRERRADGLDRGGLLDVLGDVVLDRLQRHGESFGNGALAGRFVEGTARVLQVRAGDVPVAEFLDGDRDGRVDRVLLRTHR